jgi:hypothetical protein
VSQVNPNWHTASDRVTTFRSPCVAVTKSLVAAAAHEAGIQ